MIEDIISRAAATLYDNTQVVWGPAELLNTANAGLQQIVVFDPTAYTKSIPYECSPGTRQKSPDDMLAIIDSTRNTDADLGPGRALRPCAMADMDAVNPNWHNDPPSLIARHYMADPRNMQVFYIWPPRPNPAGYIELVYHGSAPTVALTDEFPFADTYTSPLHDYLVGISLLRNEKGLDKDLGVRWVQMFLQALGQSTRSNLAQMTGKNDD
jgi:hypothetical protein